MNANRPKDQDELLMCALCPSACRRVFPPEAIQQLEMHLPSSLALLAIRMRQGVLPYDQEMRAALADLEVARLCSQACTYGFDIPAAIEAVCRDLDQRHDKG